jgi:hypothetical protein
MHKDTAGARHKNTTEARRVSRRALVTGAAGAAAAGAAAVAVVSVPALAEGRKAPVDAAAPPRNSALPKQDWVVYIRDTDTGELDVFVGTQHFAVRDSDLVARVIAAAT